MRFPGARRYPRTAAERSISNHRLSTLATAVLGAAEPCWLVQAIAEDAESVVDTRDCHGTALSRSFDFAEHHDDGTSTTWTVFAALVAWDPVASEPLLSSIGCDDVWPTLWVSTSTGAIVAPYAGGLDVFLPTRQARDAMARCFADWRA